MGAVLMAQGRIGEAIAHLKRALSLNPGLFEAYGNLAQAYMIAGRMEPAVHMLARALEISQRRKARRSLPNGSNPSNSEARSTRAYANSWFAHWSKAGRNRAN